MRAKHYLSSFCEGAASIQQQSRSQPRTARFLQCARSAVHPCSNSGTAKQGWLACGAPGIHGGVLAFDGFAQLGLVLHCGAVSSRRGLCLTTRSPHYGYEPQQRSAPGNMHLQNNMTPCFQDGGHAQGQARAVKSIRLMRRCYSCVCIEAVAASLETPLMTSRKRERLS